MPAAQPKKPKMPANKQPNSQLGLVNENNSSEDEDEDDEQQEQDDTHVKMEEWSIFQRGKVIKKKQGRKAVVMAAAPIVKAKNNRPVKKAAALRNQIPRPLRKAAMKASKNKR